MKRQIPAGSYLERRCLLQRGKRRRRQGEGHTQGQRVVSSSSCFRKMKLVTRNPILWKEVVVQRRQRFFAAFTKGTRCLSVVEAMADEDDPMAFLNNMRAKLAGIGEAAAAAERQASIARNVEVRMANIDRMLSAPSEVVRASALCTVCFEPSADCRCSAAKKSKPQLCTTCFDVPCACGAGRARRPAAAAAATAPQTTAITASRVPPPLRRPSLNSRSSSSSAAAAATSRSDSLRRPMLSSAPQQRRGGARGGGDASAGRLLDGDRVGSSSMGSSSMGSSSMRSSSSIGSRQGVSLGAFGGGASAAKGRSATMCTACWEPSCGGSCAASVRGGRSALCTSCFDIPCRCA